MNKNLVLPVAISLALASEGVTSGYAPHTHPREPAPSVTRVSDQAGVTHSYTQPDFVPLQPDKTKKP